MVSSLLSSEPSDELRLEMFFLVVYTGQGLTVEHTVVSTVVDTGTSFDTNYVGSFITRFGESWERQESSCHSIWRQLVWGWTLEPPHGLRLLVAVGHVIGVVAHVLLRRVGQTLVAGGLVGNTFGTLEECSLTSLPYWIDSILVETAGGRDGGVIVHPLAAVHGPVVVAVVVDICVSVKHQPVLTNLLSQSSIGTFVELVTILFMRIHLETVWFWTPRVLSGHRGHQ